MSETSEMLSVAVNLMKRCKHQFKQNVCIECDACEKCGNPVYALGCPKCSIAKAEGRSK